MGGEQQVRLTVSNLPTHSHQIWGTDTVANAEPPSGAIPGVVNGTHNKYYKGAPDVAIAADSLLPSGADQPHDNLQPFLALNYVICVDGVYPS
jgi:microcystin-dependent protein